MVATSPERPLAVTVSQGTEELAVQVSVDPVLAVLTKLVMYCVVFVDNGSIENVIDDWSIVREEAVSE